MSLQESDALASGGRLLGATVNPDRSVTWRVWVPRAGSVDLVLFRENGVVSFPMRAIERGIYERTEAEVAEGCRYGFSLDGGPPRADPASLWQPDGVAPPSAVLDPKRFRWTDGEWRGVEQPDLIVYELHVGTFTHAGTFDAIHGRLAQLRSLGVTALEIMPVNQFPGARNWGYDGVFPYAPQNSCGGPHGFQRLIDACHRAGLAVILDVVYNHFGPEGCHLREFGPYFTDRYVTPWGEAVNFDGSGSDAVRDFFLANVRMWPEDYHLDGLRLDATHAIHDLGAKHILRCVAEVGEEVSRRTGRPIHLIAESDANDPRLLYPPERGGHGLTGQWADDFHHVIHALLTGEDQGYYSDYTRLEQVADAPTGGELPIPHPDRIDPLRRPGRKRTRSVRVRRVRPASR
jgi:maltooligosyltrehalose trehalohydrolase